MADPAPARKRSVRSKAAEVVAGIVRILPEALMWSRSKPAQDARLPPSPFIAPDHPPGVVPDKSGIAQDEQISEVFSWAAQNAMYSAYAEGVVFLGFPYLATLAQRPEYRVITETIASEMTREWIEFKSASDKKDKADKIAELKTFMEEFSVQEVVRRSIEGDGFFGRGHIYVDTGKTDDRDELKTSIGDGRDEVSKDKIGKGDLKAFRPIEAMWCYPTDYNSNDPLQPDWYKPKIWLCMGKELHHSRLLTIVGREVPDILKPAYSFGGLSLSQMVKPYVDNWLRTRQSISDLVHSFAVWILKTNLAQRLLEAGKGLFDRVDFFNNVRDNRGTAVIDKDTEEIANVNVPLSTLDQLQAQSQEQLCSVSQIPIVKALGSTPHGLNASTEGEIRVFYDRIHAGQEKQLRKPLTTMIGFIQLSKWGEIDPDITFDFVSLWQLDDAGKAAIQQTKATTREVDIASGVITAEEGRKAAAADPDSQYAGLDLDAEPAPGEELEEEPGEGGEEAELGGPKPRVSSRLGTSLTNKAATFGGATSGGFKANDVRLALDQLSDEQIERIAAISPAVAAVLARRHVSREAAD